MIQNILELEKRLCCVSQLDVLESLFDANSSTANARTESFLRSVKSFLGRRKEERYAIFEGTMLRGSDCLTMAFLGADLAIVGSSDKDRLKISLRSKEEFYQKSGIHLGRDLAKPLGDYVKGTGGGHSLAAGITGIGKVEDALKKASEILKATISKKSE